MPQFAPQTAAPAIMQAMHNDRVRTDPRKPLIAQPDRPLTAIVQAVVPAQSAL